MHNINYCHFDVSAHCSAHVICPIRAARAHYPIGTDTVTVAQVHATSFVVLIELSFSAGKRDGLTVCGTCRQIAGAGRANCN